ncbi:MAG: FAD-dependent oxidoreductase, partial [Rhodospirillaceae bacterium]|nr:FAD-dependent oxidoreductase [Rhodospirillaceae bacterium]
MTQPFRNSDGGRIDRGQRLNFTFDGQSYTGNAGDTLASALLANGVRLVGRSFKYHRPRGIVSAGAEEPNALMQLGEGAVTEPNTRATQIELFEGLVAESQNRWPSANLDVGAVNNLLSKIFPAGFYYKTFMWPPKAWMFYEKIIRSAAGLGKAPTEPDPDVYEKRRTHCDVLVVGAGPAGLAAAHAAASSGARVILADEQPELGGSLLSSRAMIDGEPAGEWIASMRAELAAMPEVRVLARTTVAGYYDHNFLVVAERLTDHLPFGERSGPRQRLWKIRARQVVLATGAIERPLVFAENDRPGVMLADAVRTYVNRYGVRPGNRAVVFTNNDSAYRAAMDAADGGIHVVSIIDVRDKPEGALVRAAREHGIAVVTSSAITGVRGAKQVSDVEVMALREDGGVDSAKRRNIDCDLVMMSGGWNPTVHLASQSGAKMRWDDALATFVPGVLKQAQRNAGAVAGTLALEDCLREGAEAGAAAAVDAGFDAKAGAVAEVEAGAGDGDMHLKPLWTVPTDRKGAKRFHDFQNDVTAADIALAHRENYASVEHFKRYTTTGMGTDQGKTSNVNALAIMAGLRDEPIPQVGHTTFRPFYTPVTIGALAGIDTGSVLLDPVRKTPMHSWHEAHGAHFEDVGQWKRPYCYLRDGETVKQAVDREVLAVRTSVALLDASTLGKIDIQGPDAAEFLDRIYTNKFSTLKVGACRYGLMCRDDGMVFDDGVTARIGESRFLMSTTTGGAPAVLNWLEEWLQTEWTDLEVYCTSVTDHWAT